MIADPCRLNAAFFESPDVVNDYRTRNELFAPESRVLREYRAFLARSAVLDVGVGGGRTSGHLIAACRRYAGMDVSLAMIRACRERYPDQAARFFQGDARAIPMRDAAVDFVLFAHNGLDCLSHRGRMAALREIRRVLRPAGLFLFSSHSLHVLKSPHNVLRQLNQQAALQAAAENGWGVVRDDVSWFYYVAPPTQLGQLADAGFTLLAAYDMRGEKRGCEAAIDDYMIHYLATPD